MASTHLSGSAIRSPTCCPGARRRRRRRTRPRRIRAQPGRPPVDQRLRASLSTPTLRGTTTTSAIAIALVCEPAVVVLDEPTTGLDVVTQHGILAEIAGSPTKRDSASFMSPTISPWWARSPTGSQSCTPGESSRMVPRSRTDYPIQRTPTPMVWSRPIPDPLRRRGSQGIPGVAVGVGERTAAARSHRGASCASRTASSRCPTLVEVVPGRFGALLRVGAHAEAGRSSPRSSAGGVCRSAPLLEVEGPRCAATGAAGRWWWPPTSRLRSRRANAWRSWGNRAAARRPSRAVCRPARAGCGQIRLNGDGVQACVERARSKRAGRSRSCSKTRTTR